MKDAVFGLLMLAAFLALVALVTWLVIRIKNKWFGSHGLRKKALLTANELDFYRRLQRATAGEFTILVQVAMGALLDTTLKPNHTDYWKVRSKFSQKICDFVLCDKNSLQPLLIVELDDVMHDFDKDKIRDCITSLAGYRTLRFWSRNKPSVEQLSATIKNELSLISALRKLDKAAEPA